MQFYRTRPIRHVILLMTGLMFLNLSIFQAEVVMLGLNKDPDMMENIARMLAASACEEEREGGESTDTDSLEKELDIFYHTSAVEHLHAYPISTFSKHLSDQGLLYHGYLQEFCPPPEI